MGYNVITSACLFVSPDKLDQSNQIISIIKCFYPTMFGGSAGGFGYGKALGKAVGNVLNKFTKSDVYFSSQDCEITVDSDPEDDDPPSYFYIKDGVTQKCSITDIQAKMVRIDNICDKKKKKSYFNGEITYKPSEIKDMIRMFIVTYLSDAKFYSPIEIFDEDDIRGWILTRELNAKRIIEFSGGAANAKTILAEWK